MRSLELPRSVSELRRLLVRAGYPEDYVERNATPEGLRGLQRAAGVHVPEPLSQPLGLTQMLLPLTRYELLASHHEQVLAAARCVAWRGRRYVWGGGNPWFPVRLTPGQCRVLAVLRDHAGEWCTVGFLAREMRAIEAARGVHLQRDGCGHGCDRRAGYPAGVHAGAYAPRRRGRGGCVAFRGGVAATANQAAVSVGE